jgi:hypothetical protein
LFLQRRSVFGEGDRLTVGAFAHEKEHKETNDGKAITIQGELIDSACYTASVGESKGKDHAECAQTHKEHHK